MGKLCELGRGPLIDLTKPSQPFERFFVEGIRIRDLEHTRISSVGPVYLFEYLCHGSLVKRVEHNDYIGIFEIIFLGEHVMQFDLASPPRHLP